MVEREAQLASERPLIAAVIYNRLKDGITLGIDATIRYALKNWSRPLKAVRARRSTRRTTRARARACRRRRSATRASRRSARPRSPRTSSYRYYVVKPGTCGKHAFSSTDGAVRRRQPALQPRAQRGRRQVADDLLTPVALPARYGVLGWPVGHSRSPAMMRAAGLERYQRLPVAPAAFDGHRARPRRVGLSRCERDDPAQGGRARARDAARATRPARSARRTR